LANLEKAKVRDYLESVMVLDYVVSSSRVWLMLSFRLWDLMLFLDGLMFHKN
jgi:hypothetical protein